MPRISRNVRDCLRKARESALQAVEIYNKPSIPFRTGGYAVLMVIAWSALFHAIFFRRKIKPYYRKKTSKRFERIDGDYKWWDLAECIAQYFGGTDGPVRKNLEFFGKLRNKIEHRSIPELDPVVFGECQSLLLNFDQLLADEFGEDKALAESLYFSLQFARAQAFSRRGKPSAGWDEVSAFVQSFRSGLSDDIRKSNSYCWQVYLLPRIGNHRSSADIAVEWVEYDPAKPEEMQQYERVAALIKPRQVAVLNLGRYKPSQVCQLVEAATGKKFNASYHHAAAWRKHGIRPELGAPDPSVCDARYCAYDKVHNDYVYTQAWVDLLIEEVRTSEGDGAPEPWRTGDPV